MFKESPVKLMNLPILGHYEENQLVTSSGNTAKSPGLYNIIRLVLLAGAGYLSWVYILPVIFVALGQLIAIGLSLALIVFIIIAREPIFKGMLLLSNMLHKAIIRSDPFLALEQAREKMAANISEFYNKIELVKSIRREMETEATKAEAKSTDLSNTVTRTSNKARALKKELDDLVARHGVAVKEEDAYVEKSNDLKKLVADATRITAQYEQQKSFISKFAMRAKVLKKLLHKLSDTETHMQLKIADLDVSINMLKTDYNAAKKLKDASSAVVDVLKADKQFEVLYATEVITNTIINDVAITAMNLKDIDNITANYQLDSDDLYDNLDKIAIRISGGNDIPSAEDYKKESYKPSSDDINAQGAFGSLFNN